MAGGGDRIENVRSPNVPLDLRSNDLIGTARVTIHHAQAYWDIFFQRYSNQLVWCQKVGHLFSTIVECSIWGFDCFDFTPVHHGSKDKEDMDGIRSVSDLLLSSILSVGASVSGHRAMFETCLDVAKNLTRCAVFPTRCVGLAVVNSECFPTSIYIMQKIEI